MQMDNFKPRAIQSEYYGDNWRWWVGVVVNNNDPLQSGRLRVRIFGVHSEDLTLVPEESLPWAIPIIPTTEDGVSGLGRSSKLKPGAMVMGYFLDGTQSQMPIIIGSVPRFAEPAPGQLGIGSRFGSSSTAPTLNAPRNQNTNEGAQSAQGQFVSTAGAVGANNTEKAFNFLLTARLSPIQAAAIVGNLLVTSKLDPTLAGGAQAEQYIGIAKWTGINRDTYLDFANQRGLDSRILETQLQYLAYDFMEAQARLYQFTKFSTTNNLSKATEIFLNYYLRKPSTDLAKRISVAKDVHEAYNRA
jgi:hypothetical protein